MRASVAGFGVSARGYDHWEGVATLTLAALVALVVGVFAGRRVGTAITLGIGSAALAVSVVALARLQTRANALATRRVGVDAHLGVGLILSIRAALVVIGASALAVRASRRS